MTGRPWYPQFPDAYERDTSHLSMVQHGAYRLLLDHYYKTAKPLPADLPTLQRICRATTKAECTAINVILVEFFRLESDGYHNKRADEELAKAAKITDERKQAASKRHSKPDANAMQLDTHSTSTATKKKEERKSISAVPASTHVPKNPLNGHQDDFAAFYAAFPKRVAKGAAAKAYAKALKRAAPEIILAGAQHYALARKGEDANFTKNPATWLNADCWLDEAPAATGPPINAELARIQALEAEHRKSTQ